LQVAVWTSPGLLGAQGNADASKRAQATIDDKIGTSNVAALIRSQEQAAPVSWWRATGWA